jgi:hypothetical protein
MDQIVVMAGTLLASVIGLGLLAFVLLTTIGSSQRSPSSKRVQLPPVIEENQLFALVISRRTIRGYDTPELWREDDLARCGQAPDEQYLH